MQVSSTEYRVMRASLKAKLVVSFLIVVTVSGLIATIVGVRLISNNTVKQVQEKVRMDLNSAREIYNHKLRDIENVVYLTAIRIFLKDALLQKNMELLNDKLGEVREKAHLDILTITDRAGHVVFRTRNPEIHGDSQAEDELVSRALLEKRLFASTQIVPRSELIKEGEDLGDRTRIKLIPTPKARQRLENEETSGMVLKAAAPVFDDDGPLIGVLYGGNLINRNYELVDEIKDTVYQDARYKGKSEGTATIFQGNLRVSTNVMDRDGARAIGTQVSAEVHDRVLDKGERWVDRAFVVNDWYINTILIFLGITMAGAVLSLIIAYFLATGLVKPIRRLVAASQELSKGNFSQRIEPISKSEIGELESTFNFMASSLKERDDELQEQTQRQLIQSEKLASVGRLAAGVAHQINNPLTGVLTYSSLLLRKKPESDPDREDLQVIVDETMRCREIVKGLLEFSRQAEPEKEAVDINSIIENSLSLTRNQALINDVKVITQLSEQLPRIVVDGSQIQEVFLNIILNAIDAMPEGGELRVTSSMMASDQFVQIRFADTGCGIPPEDLDKVFDPFFTTKDASKGTGLGLAVAYGVIEKHHGRIRMESEVGKGTTCIIDLPVNASD